MIRVTLDYWNPKNKTKDGLFLNLVYDAGHIYFFFVILI
jgi:hypothetical protein